MIEYVAAAASFIGLAGVYRKRWWGPLVGGVASTVWCAVAIHTAQYPWASVEATYAIMNYAIARRWRRDRLNLVCRRVG